MLGMINQDEDMKISFKCSVDHQLLLGLSLTNIAPNMIWVCLFIWLSFFEHHCPQLTDSSFNRLPLPLADLNTVCFPSQGPLHCPRWSTCQGVLRSVDVISVKDFANSIDILLVWQSFYSGINSHTSKIMSIQSLVCWNEIRDVLFWKYFFKKNSSFFGQRPNTRYSKYAILWLSCILKTEIDPL